MSPEPRAEVKWDVATPELLKELIDSPPPGGLRETGTAHGFHRDIYYDTADGSLARRDVTCRFRLGDDDRRVLTVAFASRSQRFTAEVTELELSAALRGDQRAARAGCGDWWTRRAWSRWRSWRWSGCRGCSPGPGPGAPRYLQVYDIVTVRHDVLSREFREVKLSRLRPGSPTWRR